MAAKTEIQNTSPVYQKNASTICASVEFLDVQQDTSRTASQYQPRADFPKSANERREALEGLGCFQGRNEAPGGDHTGSVTGNGWRRRQTTEAVFINSSGGAGHCVGAAGDQDRESLGHPAGASDMSREVAVIGRAEIGEDELQGMIREAINQGVRANIFGAGAWAYWDRIEDLLALLREEMPELLNELGL
jgi:hypothetical protein